VTQVRVKEVIGTIQVVDGEALLTPQLLERIVGAVLSALGHSQRDEESRRRDTRIAGACCDSCDGEQAG